MQITTVMASSRIARMVAQDSSCDGPAKAGTTTELRWKLKLGTKLKLRWTFC